MNQEPKKLTLSQETLRNLSQDGRSGNQFASGHNCTAVTVCSPFSCTLAPC